MDNNVLKELACAAIDDASGDLKELSDKIWSKPELALKEFYAHDVITDFLEKHSFQNIEKNFHLKTAFRSVNGNVKNGPHIAVMSEYDALPDIGHACGHNLIAEVGVATALGVKAALEKSTQPFGQVTLLGTPAEEHHGGKVDLISAGVLKDVDAAMMAHPSKYAVLRPNYVAIKEVTIDFTGVEAHAAEWPWEGVNALDAAILCYNNVSCFRQQLPPGWMIHGIVTNGGARPNIIPGHACLEFYIRTRSNKDLVKLEEKLTNCAKGAAVATGCQVDVRTTSTYKNLITNEEMIKLYEENATKLGIEIEYNEEITKKLGGSTDMGNVSHEVPSIHPEFVIGADCNSHTQGFTPAAGDPKAQKLTLDVAKALAMTCIDVMTNQDLLQKIKAEFNETLEC